MKKQLLAGAFVLASFFTAQAQTQENNFNTLNLGDLSTVVNGSAAGQDNWYVISQNSGTTTNLGAAAVQVVAGDEAHGNVLQLTGPNGTAGGAIAAKLPGQFYLDAANAGNTTFSTQFDFFTGSLETSSFNIVDVTAYSVDTTTTPSTFYALGGFNVFPDTNEIYGVAYLDATEEDPADNYLIGLSETAGETFILPENTWVTLSYSINGDTGVMEFLAVANGETLFALTFEGASAEVVGLFPTQIQFGIVNGAANNTASLSRQFDNINFTAGDSSILATKPVAAMANLAVYPNPANDVVNVNVDALVSNVAIVDLNGRTVKSVKFDGVSTASVNVSDLASGIYMMTVSSDKGTSTKKIVKN